MPERRPTIVMLRPREIARAMRTLIRAAGVTALIAGLSGCGGTPSDDSAFDQSSEPKDELSLHNGEFCPVTLPRAPQETFGFGTEKRATKLPSFPAFDEAWLCTYRTRDIAPAGSNGAWYEWVRDGTPRELSPDQVASFSDAVNDLRLIGGGEYACDSDLGARYLVSFVWERDLTGVVVDDYGCGSVRLTDDPFATVPGDASQPGTVPGLFAPPAGLLRQLGVGRAL